MKKKTIYIYLSFVCHLSVCLYINYHIVFPHLKSEVIKIIKYFSLLECVKSSEWSVLCHKYQLGQTNIHKITLNALMFELELDNLVLLQFWYSTFSLPNALKV